MAKYTVEEKLEIVKDVLENGLAMREAAVKYHADRSDVKKWVAAYDAHGMAGISRQYNRYSGDFKREAVEYMLANGMSLCETATKYNLGSHDVIANWKRIYLEEGREGLYVERRGGNSSKQNKMDKKVKEDLIAENRQLRMENDYLKKLNALVQEREKSEWKKKPR